ncbi:tetratricopeptide repeat-containing protein [Besnoitia besnoiti]|uniref:Tetratricopeptide repeat-containing protein n=1 Tax=Besnoitia besnoiti TaxID=94643 RepID=A0A2A9MAR0_BESBE|nr:tetratricopeptide repeat-containing protein [Besnoitia besnoiti]PFH32773.1 tetratricopeptide repeat-containing protein [Besnoitia besnoiti]
MVGALGFGDPSPSVQTSCQDCALSRESERHLPRPWHHYEQLLKAAIELSEACGLPRQRRLFRDFLNHNIDVLDQLYEQHCAAADAAPRRHPKRRSSVLSHRAARVGCDDEDPQGSLGGPSCHDHGLAGSDAHVVACTEAESGHLATSGEKLEDKDHATGFSSGERSAEKPTDSVSRRLSQLATVARSARRATRCTHTAVEVYRHLRASSVAEGAGVFDPSATYFAGRVSSDLIRSTATERKSMMVSEFCEQLPLQVMLEKLSWAWSCVVLHAPRQDVVYALFGDMLFSAHQQHQRQPLRVPLHLCRNLGASPILSTEEDVIIRIAAFLALPVNPEDAPRSSASGSGYASAFRGACAHHVESADGSRSRSPRPREPFARRGDERLHVGAQAWRGVTEIGISWYLLAMVYERDSRTTAETPEERAFLRRCAAVCYLRCLLAWPFMLHSWARLVPLVMSEPSSLYCLSLLLYHRDEQRACRAGESARGAGARPASASAWCMLASARDVLGFLFSAAKLRESAFFSLVAPHVSAVHPPAEAGRAPPDAASDGVSLFASVLHRVAAVQLCMARGEARDALALLETWTLLPEGSSFMEEIIGCCFLQAGQPERGVDFLLRSVQQHQLLEQEDECLRRQEGGETLESPEDAEKDAAEACPPALEPPEEAGCRCSSALWQVGRRRAATALVDWLLQRPGAQTSPQLWGAVGNLLSLHRKSDEALKALFRAVELADDYPYAYTLCAHELLQRNQREEAQALIEHGIQSRGLLKSLPLHALSLLLELQRQAKSASERGKCFSGDVKGDQDLERQRTLPGCLEDPASLKDLERLQHPQTLKKIAEQLLRVGQARRAYNLLLRAARMMPGDGEIFYRLGCIKISFHQYGEALQFLQRAARLAPLDPDVQVALSRVYSKLLQPRQAFRHLQAALRLTTDAEEQNRISDQVTDLWSCTGVDDEFLTGVDEEVRPRKYRRQDRDDPIDEIYMDSPQPADIESNLDDDECDPMALPESAIPEASHYPYPLLNYRLTRMQEGNAVSAASLRESSESNAAETSRREWANVW